jgi:hypothetical protein
MADRYKQMGRLPLAQLNLDQCGGPLVNNSVRFVGDFVSVSLTNFEKSLVDAYCENSWEHHTCGYKCSVRKVCVGGGGHFPQSNASSPVRDRGGDRCARFSTDPVQTCMRLLIVLAGCLICRRTTRHGTRWEFRPASRVRRSMPGIRCVS